MEIGIIFVDNGRNGVTDGVKHFVKIFVGENCCYRWSTTDIEREELVLVD